MQGLKLFAVLLVGTLFVFFSGQFGQEWVANKFISKKFKNETLIGTEFVENKSKSEAINDLNTAVESWTKEGTIFLEWTGDILTIEKSEFVFKIEDSVEAAIDGSGNQLMVNLPDLYYLKVLEELTGNEQINTEIDLEKLKKDIEGVAATLSKEDTSFSLANYLLEAVDTEEILHEVSLKVGKDLIEEVKGISTISLEPNATFSLQSWLKDGEIELSDNGSSVVATMLYQLLLPTNIEIVERHISKEIPEWTKAGYEATFKKDKMDFQLYNPNNYVLTMEISLSGSQLKGTISGQPLSLSYEIIEETKETYKPKTIIQYSPLVQQNQKQMKEAGKSGEYAVIVRNGKNSTGEIVETTIMAKDFYAPIHQVEVHSVTRPANPTPPASNSGNNSSTGNNNGANTGNNSGNTTDNSNSNNTNGNNNATGGGNTNNNNASGGSSTENNNDQTKNGTSENSGSNKTGNGITTENKSNNPGGK